MRKKSKRIFSKRVLSLLLALMMSFSTLATDGVFAAKAADADTRVADPSTSERWKLHFGPDVMDTDFAGSVWTDKSVYTDDTDIGGAVVNLKDPDNFLVSLSTIGSTKTVTGMSNVPIDVMIILDLSSSMYRYGNNNFNPATVRQMCTAVNNTIDQLQNLNKDNRVGVNLYYGASSIHAQSKADESHKMMLTLDRYTKGTKGYINANVSGNKLLDINVPSDVRNSANKSVATQYPEAGTDLGIAGTYAQLGILEAMNQFLAASTKTSDGKDRLPVFIFMSDGEPTAASENFSNRNYANATMGNNRVDSRNPNETDFVTQLTASWAKEMVDVHYEKYTPLFYTLSLGNSISLDVMNPKNQNNTTINNYWSKLVQNGSCSFTTWNFKTGVWPPSPVTSTWINDNKNRLNWPTHTVVKADITDASGNVVAKFPTNVNQRLYVDQAYTATNADDLASVFASIVSAINLQSRFYPTLTDDDTTSSGHVSFLDNIGEYMTVTDVKGVLIGSTLYSGYELAKNFIAGGADMGNFNNPNELGVKFRKNVMEGIGIAEDRAATELIKAAYDHGQLSCNDAAGTYSNYIGWYADANSTYLGHWYEGMATPSYAANAKYYIKSYFYQGTVHENEGVTEATDMMHIIAWVRTEIATGREAVIFSVPGALLPTVVYNVSLDKEGNPTGLTVEGVENPVELVYEVGLKDGINGYNLHEKVSKTYLSNNTNADGSVNFYTNEYERDGAVGYNKSNSYSYFKPSKENDRYYYEKDYPVLNSQDENDVCSTNTLDPNKTYYRSYEIYKKEGDNVVKEVKYVAIMPDTIAQAAKDSSGKWYIPKGNVHTNTQGYLVNKEANSTDTLSFANKPYVDSHNAQNDPTGESFIIGATLGNNGKLTLAPAAAKKVALDPIVADRVDITDADGEIITVGDVLTYTIDVKNTEDRAAQIVITDTIPAGTKLVEDSITEGGEPTGNTIKWTFENVPAGNTKTVSFKVEVTEEVLDTAVTTVDNQAQGTIGDNVFITNTVTNIPQGKKVEASDAETDISQGVQVGDELRYTIEYYNDQETASTVKILDKIPKGTEVLTQKISDGGYLTTTQDEEGPGYVKWILENVQPNVSGTVEFTVVVDESAKTPIENDATIKVGDHDPYQTNTTETKVLYGDLSIAKIVDNDFYNGYENEVYTLSLTSRSTATIGIVHLTGTFDVSGNGSLVGDKITFTDGRATLQIKSGETITIKDLPAGLQLKVEETYVQRGSDPVVKLADSGYIATYVTDNATTSTADDTTRGTISVLPSNADTTAEPAVPNTNINKLTVTNTYKPQDVTYRLVGKKHLTVDAGVSTGETIFEFALWASDINAQVYNEQGQVDSSATPLRTVLAKVQSSAPAADIIFPNNTIKSEQLTNNEHTAYYIVKELQDMAKKTIAYDATQYHVKIVTTDNGKGQLQVQYSYRTRTGDTGSWSDWTTAANPTLANDGVNEFALVNPNISNNADGITFDNKYTPAEATLTLEAKKYMTGRDMTAEEFSYVVTDVTDPQNHVVVGTEANKTLSADKMSADIAFTPLIFYKPGTYTYEVREVTGDRANVTYDTAVYTVTVVVAQDSQNTHQLKVTSTTYTVKRAGQSAATAVQATVTDPAMVFNNTYGSFRLEGNKTLELRDFDDQRINVGSAVMEQSEYDFVVYATDSNGVGNTVAGGGYNAAEDNTSDTDDTASIIFDHIYYSVTAKELKDADDNGVAKNLYFRIEEAKPTVGTNPYMDYDDSVWYVTVPIVYDETTGKVETGTIQYRKDSTTATPDTDADFTNIEYPHSITVVPEAKKIISEGNPPAGITFSFTVRNASNGATVATGSAGVNHTTPSEAQTVNFSTITITEAGTYQYWIMESNAGTASNNGITYDANKYLMTVAVSKTSGKLKIDSITYTGFTAGDVNKPESYKEPIGTAGIIFDNKYDANGYVNLTARKSLVKRDSNASISMEAGQFDFRLERVKKNDDGSYSKYNTNDSYINGTNDSNGLVTFATIYFSDEMFTGGETEKTLYYRMSEVDLGLPGYDYSDTTYIVAIKISYNKDSDIIKVTEITVTEEGAANASPITVTYTVGSAEEANGITGASIGATFANTYLPVSPDSIKILTTKTLDNRALVENEFTFRLHHVVNGDITSTAPDNYKLLATTSNKLNSVTGKYDLVSFERFYDVSTPPGVYVYRITEENEGMKGIIYDTEPVYAYVKVADVNGHITATLHNSREDADQGVNAIDTSTQTLADGFKNVFSTYTPVNITKKMTGRELLPNRYAFEILDKDNNVVSTGYNTAVQAGTTDNSASVIFAPLQFSALGTYEYKIKELAGANAAVTYDPAIYYLKVVVSEDGAKGTYYKDAEYEEPIDSIVFNNDYKASGVLQLHATKELEGRDLAAGEFSFEVRDGEGKLITTGSNRADGTVDFGTVAYDQSHMTYDSQTNKGEGKFTYYMKEIVKADGTNGITYAKDIYQIKVTVTDDGNGFVKTEATYHKKAGDSYEALAAGELPIFKNTYKAEPIDIPLAADKSVLGKNIRKQDGTFEKFNFKVSALTNNSTLYGKEPIIAENDAEGIVRFTGVKETEAGTYKYLIEEAPITANYPDGTMTADITKYLAVVVIKNNGFGKLTVESVAYYKWDASVSEITKVEQDANKTTGAAFINTYVPNKITVSLTDKIAATKTVTGQPYTLRENDFQFQVVDAQDNIVATGKNLADGTITFTDFTFTMAGSYFYRVKEVKPATVKPGFTYDDREWEVRIEVKFDADKGKLEVDSVKTYEFSRGAAEARPAFENEYNPTPVAIIIRAGKDLLTANNNGTGRTLRAGEFTFRVLEEVAGTRVVRDEASNDADGNVEFVFMESNIGTHNYVIEEVIPTTKQPGITYDTSAYAVAVEVEDENGVLKAKLKGSNEALATPYTVSTGKVFTNKYAGLPVKTNIVVKKILHGAELANGAFTFELAEAANPNNVIATATNDVDGNVVFDVIYTEATPAGQPHSYIVREKAVAGTDITYDTSTIAITVDVVDKLDGRLSAVVNYPTDVTFENTYNPPEKDDDITYKAFGFTKKWADNDNVAGKRPDSIIVEVYQDGVYVTDVELKAEDDWFATSVLMYSQNEHVYTWTIKEKNVPKGYTAVYDQSSYTVTNIYKDFYEEIGSPQTGDTNPTGLLLALAGISVLGIGALFVRKKKRSDK